MRIIGSESVRAGGVVRSLATVGYLTRAELGRTDDAWLDAQTRFRARASDPAPWSLEWRWAWRERSDGRLATLALHGGENVEALASYRLGRSSLLTANAGRPALVLEYLASAPWNRSVLCAIGLRPTFEGAGLAMVRAVVRMSVARGCEGRVSVFPILGSASFYRDVCGMVPAVRIGLDGCPEDWYELTPEAAALLLSGGGA